MSNLKIYKEGRIFTTEDTESTEKKGNIIFFSSSVFSVSSVVKKSFFLFLLVIGLSSCGRTYLSVQQEWIDARYLASTHVNTPDPRQANPPFGQRLLLNWWVPREILDQSPQLVVQVIFKNFTQKTVTFPIKHRTGYKIFSLLNEEYYEKRGLLTWRAQIVTSDHKVFKEWKHQLWVNLIEINEKPAFTPEPIQPIFPKDYGHDDTDEEYYGKVPALQSEEIEPSSLEEEMTACADRMSSSVEDQSKQGSVIETPDFNLVPSPESD